MKFQAKICAAIKGPVELNDSVRGHFQARSPLGANIFANRSYFCKNKADHNKVNENKFRNQLGDLYINLYL